MILFLDFDGVLHPDAVYLQRGRPVLHAEGALFMWAPLLADILSKYPHVQIVLSTSWARHFGFARARDFLPESLRQRAIGATWHSGMAQHSEGCYSTRYSKTWWDSVSRYEQIKHWVERANQHDWIALEDQPLGWNDADRDKLIQTDSTRGLSDIAVVAKLYRHLSA